MQAAQLPGFQASLARLPLTEHLSYQCEGLELGVVGREAGVRKEVRWLLVRDTFTIVTIVKDD